MVKVEIRVRDEDDLLGKVLLTGFHGVGYVGWITVRHLVKSLKARRIGFVYSPYMTPYVSMGEGIVTPYELYAADNLVMFVPNVPLSSREITALPMKLAEYAVSKGVSEAILIGGLDSRLEDKRYRVKYAATSAYLKSKQKVVEKLDLGRIEEYLYKVGPLAVMLSIFETLDFPALTLLPYANIARPDPRAAAEAIKVLNNLLGLNVGVEELLRDEEQIEEEIKELEERIKRSGMESKMLYV